MTTKKGSTEKKSGEEKTSKWDSIVGSFAKAIEKSLEEVNAKLKDLVGEPGDEAMGFLLSEEDCPTADIKAAFGDVPKAKLNNAVRTILRNNGEKAAETSKAGAASSAAMVSLDLLPKEISEENLLEFLRTGGVLKVNSATVTMAMRAALASRTGVFEIRKTLIDKMKVHSESLDEPVGENFFKINNELTREKYGDIFAAIPGAGKFVSEVSKKEFLAKMNSSLWPSLYSFQEQLAGWVQSWQQGAANPAAVMMAMTAMMSGNTGGPLPAGIMAPPSTDGLHDAASSFIDVINRVFSGTGTIVASALGYEAKTLMDVLNNTDLPGQIGASNKDQMLKMLNINVSADVSRLATNAARYALSIMEFPKVTAGNEEMAYITALFQLGAAIPWEQLKGVSKAGIRESHQL